MNARYRVQPRCRENPPRLGGCRIETRNGHPAYHFRCIIFCQGSPESHPSFRLALLLRLGRRGLVPWSGPGGEKPAAPAWAERGAGADPAVRPAAPVAMCTPSDGATLVCLLCASAASARDGWDSRAYARGVRMPSVGSTWVAAASAHVDPLYLLKFQHTCANHGISNFAFTL